jgi:GATA-binding protein, other eukaryote
MGQRRTSQKSANGHSEGSNSPISRTATPSMFNNHGMPTFNTHPYEDHYNHHSPSLPPMHIRHPSPGRSASPLNGVNGLEVPQTYEQLIAQCSSMKTRISELEVINDLFKSRVDELEQSAQRHISDKEMAERREAAARQAEQALSQRLEESQRRENQLKHRLDDVEREFGELKGNEQRDTESRDGPPAAKKMRVSDMVGDDEISTPASTT